MQCGVYFRVHELVMALCGCVDTGNLECLGQVHIHFFTTVHLD